MTSLEPGPGVASDESNQNLHSNSVSPSCHGASDSFEHILGTLFFGGRGWRRVLGNWAAVFCKRPAPILTSDTEKFMPMRDV